MQEARAESKPYCKGLEDRNYGNHVVMVASWNGILEATASNPKQCICGIGWQDFFSLSGMDQQTTLRLNLGCGLQCPDGWVNIDCSLGVRLAKRALLKKILHSIVPGKLGILPNEKWPGSVKWMNITRRFTYDDASVDSIYSSHTIEHLTYNEAAFVFKEAFRVIKPGGVIRIVVPDFAHTVNNYLTNRQNTPHLAAKKFLDDTLYFHIPVPDNLPGLVKFYFKRKNNHYFLYDEEGLRYQLTCAGFADVSSMQWGRSRISGIEKIDIPERFRGAICLEGIKP